MIRAIVFDFGGVLVRTADPPEGRREWEARLGLPAGGLARVVHGSAAWLEAQRGVISPDAYWQVVGETLGIVPEDIPALQRDYFRDDHLDMELMRIVHSFRERGYKLGLLSNEALSLETKLRDLYRIDEAFDVIVISARIGVMKPDAAAYQAMIDALGVKAGECIFIDDHPANVEGARVVGMQAIQFRAGMDIQGAIDALIQQSGNQNISK